MVQYSIGTPAGTQILGQGNFLVQADTEALAQLLVKISAGAYVQETLSNQIINTAKNNQNLAPTLANASFFYTTNQPVVIPGNKGFAVPFTIHYKQQIGIKNEA